ncbi:hypothetical protein M23134_06507 [Microscilla marina ATCC 23134]|uniref:Uncharacterized protein n=1 Tax=Microscilla marina ATCC 23134 TaxID=313606 RepID=A1ZQP2_MICM2|nr:hypothetical protein M23134_06507 [Microscilla marina ATCC 23134]
MSYPYLSLIANYLLLLTGCLFSGIQSIFLTNKPEGKVSWAGSFQANHWFLPGWGLVA